jgi:hypothetical protein
MFMRIQSRLTGMFSSIANPFLRIDSHRLTPLHIDPATSFDTRLQLIKILRHMHNDIAMARQVGIAM